MPQSSTPKDLSNQIIIFNFLLYLLQVPIRVNFRFEEWNNFTEERSDVITLK